MRRITLLVIYFLGALLFPAVALAQVIINEFFFDPARSDAGLEWVELYNATDSTLNLSGWQLYPDGIGYFYFPENLSVPARGYAVVNLRVSGQNSETSLYHSTPTSNMGNSSGSLALFSGEPRGKDTIKAFVRYHKPGSYESKTWESDAVKAGLWQTGAFIDISSIAEGASIGLTSGGVTAGFQRAWMIFSSATKGTANNQAPSSEAPEAADQTLTTGTPSVTAPLYVSQPAPVSANIGQTFAAEISSPMKNNPAREVMAAAAVIENSGEEPKDPPALTAALDLPARNKWFEIALFAGALLLGAAGALFVFFGKRPL